MTTPKYDLPTAIRIGAKIRPQGYDLFRHNGLSCVFGAALEAEDDADYLDCSVLWPEMNQKIDGDKNLFEVIIWLNDYARWTREEIADWVDMVLP